MKKVSAESESQPKASQAEAPDLEERLRVEKTEKSEESSEMTTDNDNDNM